MRSYDELLSPDPAWPHVEALAAAAGRRATVLPRAPAAARACLEQLQVTTRSVLGALAHETGGILVDHGWLRLFGSGHASLGRTLGGWNAALGIPVSDFLLVGDDAVGGSFAVDGGALGEPGAVFYFAPDALAWQSLGAPHSKFVPWALGGDLASFYGALRWPGWEGEVAALGGDQTLSLVPPPWTKEGKDLAKVARRAVPAREAWELQQRFAKQLG